jgi:hypothetical protein
MARGTAREIGSGLMGPDLSDVSGVCSIIDLGTSVSGHVQGETKCLKDYISQQEASDRTKDSWNEALSKHDLGIREFSAHVGDEGQQNLEQAVNLMRRNLSQQSNQVKAQQLFIHALEDYGTSLALSRIDSKNIPVTQSEATRFKRETKADMLFDEALALAKKCRFSTVEQTEILRKAADNKIDMSLNISVDVNHATTLLEDAERELQLAIMLLQKDTSNDAIEAQALNFSDMGNLEYFLGSTSKERENLYRSAIKMWHDYDPSKHGTTQAEHDYAAKQQHYDLYVDLKLLGGLLEEDREDGIITSEERSISIEISQLQEQHPDFHSP